MVILGLKFRPMTDSDRQGLAGASDTSLINDASDYAVLLYDPDTGTISELYQSDGDTRQRDWTSEQVL